MNVYCVVSYSWTLVVVRLSVGNPDHNQLDGIIIT